MPAAARILRDVLDAAAAIDMLKALGRPPALPGAKCAGKSAWFDAVPLTHPEHEFIEQTALSLCRRCPALEDCRRWRDSLPPADRPEGVIAGRIIKAAHRRKTA
jgi:hypothetical protein